MGKNEKLRKLNWIYNDDMIMGKKGKKLGYNDHIIMGI